MRIRFPFLLWVLALSLLPLSACGGGRYVVENSTAPTYTMINLRVQQGRLVSSIGYQNQSLMPVCTPVQIDRVRGRRIAFTNLTTGQRMRYEVHRADREIIDTHLQRVFGTSCPDIAQMSQADLSGIQNGQVYNGMSKAGVLIAVGYPPSHRTPTLDQDVWRFWRTRFNQFEVYFTNGLVSGIRE